MQSLLEHENNNSSKHTTEKSSGILTEYKIGHRINSVSRTVLLNIFFVLSSCNYSEEAPPDDEGICSTPLYDKNNQPSNFELFPGYYFVHNEGVYAVFISNFSQDLPITFSYEFAGTLYEGVSFINPDGVLLIDNLPRGFKNIQIFYCGQSFLFKTDVIKNEYGDIFE